jgi:transposase-like protein
MTHIFAITLVILAQLSRNAKLILEYSTVDNNHKTTCPRCGSHETIKNGSIHNGKPKNKCKHCDRQSPVCY